MAERATQLCEDQVSSPKPPSASLADVWRDAANADVPLGERLAMYRQASSMLRPDFAKAYDELVERLAVLDQKVAAQQAELTLAEQDLAEANAQFTEAAKRQGADVAGAGHEMERRERHAGAVQQLDGGSSIARALTLG